LKVLYRILDFLLDLLERLYITTNTSDPSLLNSLDYWIIWEISY